MYKVNNPYYKNHIFDLNREIDMEVYIGEDLIDNSEVLSKLQFTFDSGMEEYTVGKIIYGKLETVFYNTINITNGSIITVKLKLKVFNTEKNEWEWVTVPWGSYIVTEVVKKELVINVTAYPSLYTKLNLGFFPKSKTYTTRTLMAEIASKLGISFNVNNISEINLENPDTVDGEGNATEGTRFVGKTYAELISLVAMVCASNVIFTRDGSIEFKKLTESDVTLNNYKQPTRGEDIYTIKQVKMVNENNKEFKAGETVVADQILSLSNQFATDAIAQSILNSVKNISYKAWSSTFKAPLHLDPLDIVTFNYKGEAVKVPAMYTKYIFAKNVGVCEIQSKVNSSTTKQTEFTGTITQKVNNIYTDIISVKDMKADKVSVNRLDAEVANIKELYATKIEVDDLYARKAEIDTLIADTATIKNLKANKADITDLKATNAEVENLKATKAEIKDLDATNANIGTLTAKVADINSLVNGNLTSDNIQSLILTSDKVTVENGFIKNAMIDSLNASKINTGTLNASKVKIASEDGSMVLQGNLQQFKDKDGKVRIQIGKDTTGDFKFILYDEDGKGILIDETGIQDSDAIKDGLIVDTHVAENAAISANKLDIGSLFSVINEDGSHTLNSSKIVMDADGQTLDVAFNSMNTKIENNTNGSTEAINTLTTALNVEKGRINTLVSDTTEIKETIGDQGDSITTLNDNYSSLNQTVNGISSTVGSHTTQIKNLGDEIDKEVSSLNSKIEQTKEDITLSVSETYITKTDSQTNINKAKKEAISTAASDATSKANTAKNDAIKSANSTLTSTISNYYTKSQTDSQINVAKEAINLGVSTTYETKENVESKVSSTLDSAKSYADTKKKEAISTAATDATSKANTAKNDAIKSANSTLTSTIANYYTKKQTDSQINVAKEAINLSVSNTYETKTNVQTKINNISIGSVNRLTGTSKPYSMNMNNSTAYTNWDPYFTPDKQTLSQLGFKVGDQVTIGFNWKISKNGSKDFVYGNFRSEFVGYKSSGDLEFKGNIKNPVATFSASNTSGRSEVTVTLTETNLLAVGLRIRIDNSVLILTLSDVKLEKGNKATSWSPAPEDIESDITTIESETTSLKQTVSSLALGADSISASVKSLEETMTNTTNGLANDISKVQEQVNLAMTSSDVKLEIQKELANGVKKVSTSTGFTFDDKGLMINKSDSEMNTQITEDGMKIYKNKDVMLTANNQGVDAKNLHATTYLIIGGNSRMEDFTEDGKKRTAVFWIG